MTASDAKPKTWIFVLGGLVAGLLINGLEYLVHGVLLDRQWTAAFGALGKTPRGWAIYIPSNFVVGIVGVWIYGFLRPRYGPGSRTVLLSALWLWVVFWVIPMGALQPMQIFPNVLLLDTIALGVIDCIAGVLLGAWVYNR